MFLLFVTGALLAKKILAGKVHNKCVSEKIAEGPRILKILHKFTYKFTVL